jgi:glutamyl-tRNA reductase
MLDQFKVIAFTFKKLSFEQIGQLHKTEAESASYFQQFLKAFQLKEMMYLSTCNRVEFFIVTEREIDHDFLQWFVHAIKPELSKTDIQVFVKAAEIYTGIEAVEHMMRLSASLDSMVVGEREIITQVRQAFEHCRNTGLVGDSIRLVMRQTIETAKQVFSETTIAHHPVSVVSLAYRELLERINLNQNLNIVLIGAGQSVQSFANYLSKEVKAQYSIFNRSIDRAENIAQLLNGKAYALETLQDFNQDIDVIVSCTGSDQEMVDAHLLEKLDQNKKLKMVIDLAIPADVNQAAVLNRNAIYVGLEALESIAKNNLKFRNEAISEAEAIIHSNLLVFESLYKERQIERAFSAIPEQIKNAKEKAINEVFAEELAQMDEASKAIVFKALNYLEKKANAALMTAAKSEFLA